MTVSPASVPFRWDNALGKNLRQLLLSNARQQEDRTNNEQNQTNDGTSEKYKFLADINPLALVSRPKRGLSLSIPVDTPCGTAGANEASLAGLGRADALAMRRTRIGTVRACVGGSVTRGDG